ncbi:hypothetical protein M501DRAFT_1010660 [Patellaria atrata CBS 101060]|uniref:Uncharacterized protein n=1 Tax=Patellaria atrata CBS 101060 TaxID=1346257 RepID=A0A9P4VS67_9PEZI|nr:hypothetical protein M501DRAFT_1010660 [Patellaria atrata CBS 101060]
MDKIAELLDAVNFKVSRSSWRLFEFSDQWFMPCYIRHRVQDALTFEWTHRIPIIQTKSPAQRASDLLLRTLNRVPELSNSKLTIIDFCSGGGGPVPVIENLVNSHLEAHSRPAIPFSLSDLHPNIDSWMEHTSRSPNLSFIPNPVDAADPPLAAQSATSSSHPSSSNGPSSFQTPDTKILRLYCLAFHHLPNPVARAVLQSTLETADAFAILELQDRRILSLPLMLMQFPLALLSAPFWFGLRPLPLLFTYVIPVIPTVLAFDGFVSALRTREFEEVVDLIGGNARGLREMKEEGGRRTVRVWEGEGWVVRWERELHTWPAGYMGSVVGWKIR